MRKLIKFELQRFSIKYHMIGVLIANIIILFLAVVASLIMKATSNVIGGTVPAFEFNLTSIELAMMLVRATLIVWEAVLLAQIVVEEYRSKTITLLYTYPYNLGKIIAAKFLTICGVMLLFHGISLIIQNALIKIISVVNSYVSYKFDFGIDQILIIFSCVGLGLMPVYIGMLRKSTIATVVTSLIVVCITSSSQGNSTGIISIPVVSVILGCIGVIMATVTINKMCKNDLLV